MDLSLFDYNLPKELIAQQPADRRDRSRLLVVHRETGRLEETHFECIHHYLTPNDLLVMNDTYVIPARLFGKKQPGGASIEMLLLERIDRTDWEVIAYRASRLKPGTAVVFSNTLKCEVIQPLTEGKFRVRFQWQGNWDDTLLQHGNIPLPPYIERDNSALQESDRERYQTVYAKQHEKLNSAAAPTAGLHFTPQLLQELQNSGVQMAEVTLRVGLDTFLPMRVDTVEEHRMHAESYSIPQTTVEKIRTVRQDKGRIVAVGTTSTRVLESSATEGRIVHAGEQSSRLFIYPGYRFQVVDAIITNFHLPRSTLLLLVSAFMGNELRKNAYEYAILNRFRFYSYGDAMLIL